MFDLHTHSNCSDGELSPQALIGRAREKGVTALAITDHDTVKAWQDGLQALGGPELIPGVEFSTTWNSLGIHIVGLNVDPWHDALQTGVQFQQMARAQRAKAIAEQLEQLGHSGSLTAATGYAGDAAVGRPHFARFLVETGAVSTIEQAFKRYLGAGKPGDVREHWADLETVVGWICAAGGVAVLAHPLKYRLTRTRLKRLLNAFIAAGGQALEVVSGQQTQFQTQDLAKLAQAHNLAASCGSDFHRPGPTWSELGRFHPLPQTAQPVWDLF